MGCSASTHAGLIGGVGGLYAPPNDDGDTSWSPRSVADVRGKRRGEGGNDDEGDDAAGRRSRGQGQGCGGEAPAAPPCHREGVPCGTLAPMGCPVGHAGPSPERRPFPPGPGPGHGHGNDCNNDDSSPVEDALNECCRPSQSGGIGSAIQPLNESLSGWNNNSILDQDDALPGPPSPLRHFTSAPSPGSSSAGHPAFVNRRWISLPEHQYDMDTPHPPLPPFLGSMYWTAASPQRKGGGGRRGVAAASMGKRLRAGDGDGDGGQSLDVPSLITDSPADSCTRFGIQEEPEYEEGGPAGARAENLLPTLSSADDWESTSVSSSSGEKEDRCANDDDGEVMNRYSPRTSVDISRELLDYSAVDESFVVPTRNHQSPRRLFDDDDDNIAKEENPVNVSFEVIPKTPLRRPRSDQPNARTRSFQSILCMSNLSAGATIDENDDVPYFPGVKQASTRPLRPKMNAPSSPNVATFYGNWGSRRERHVSTLPSPKAGEPIRLRVTESGLSGGHHRSITPSASRIGHSMSGQTPASSPSGDFFSYDPYFSTGKYTVTLPNGRPYGNGLVMKVGWKFMILEDSRGDVAAVVKSRHTHAPSAVVYAPKARHDGQAASGHRLTRPPSPQNGDSAVPAERMSNASVVDGDDGDGCGAAAGGDVATVPLYPWALVSKQGRDTGDDCTVHLANGEGAGGGFQPGASFRGRHGFDRGLRTHTVVSRTTRDAGGVPVPLEGAGVPCCVIVRDPSNLDAVDITIAPGIDPLLMICYLASHSKMDVEPLMSGY